MNKREFERMISLADERYVDEMFEDRIYGGRKKFYFGIGAVAAALMLICGAGFIAANMGGSEDIAETLPNGFASASPDDFIVDDISDAPVDYSKFFANKLTEQEMEVIFKEEIAVDSDFDKMIFGNEHTRSVMPFDTSIFNTTDATFLYDGDNNVEFIQIQLGKSVGTADVSELKACGITVFREGELLSKLKREDHFPVKRFGTDIYGFEIGTAEPYSKAAIFSANGSEYMLDFGKNMTYDEAGTIIDAIIKNGISAADFDLSEAYKYAFANEDISLAEANSVEPFAGYIPQNGVISDMGFFLYRGVTYVSQMRDGKIMSQLMIFTLQNPVDRYVTCYYYTENEMTPYDSVIGIGDITREFILGAYSVDRYSFTVDCGDFMINFVSNIFADELYSFIEKIGGDLGDTVTLAEANAVEPFAGYVPQLENIGDMKLGDISHKGIWLSLNYSVQESEKEFACINATYTTSDVHQNYSVITLAGLTPDAVEFERYGNGEYRFAIGCGDFFICIDAENCSFEQLWEYVGAVRENAAVTEERARQHEEEERKLAEEAEKDRREEEVKALETDVINTKNDLAENKDDEDEEHSETEAAETVGGDTQNILTADKIKELAKKGDELTWSDFDGYDFLDVGSGLYIREYAAEGGCTLMVGGVSPEEKPMYIYLNSKKGLVDIRYESVDDLF